MKRLKHWFYKISYSEKNPIYKALTKKAPIKQIFGESYTIDYDGTPFDVQIEKGEKGIIFDIHGGGYLFGNYMDENHFCHYLHEQTGMSVVSCNYDLSTKSQFPTQIEQIYDTVKTICKDETINTDKIIVMGHSAGGNAAAAITLMSNARKDFQIDGEILVYPVLDLFHDPKSRPKVAGNILPPSMMETFNIMYFKNTDDAKSIYASPILATDEELKKLPPTYILTCAKDSLRIDGIRYGKRLKKLSIDLIQKEVNEIHGFLENGMYNFYGKSESECKSALEETKQIIGWIKEKID